MAAPPEIKLSDLTGDWVMNKTLSDDPDPVLALQGMGWLTRKALSFATVYLHIVQSTTPENKTYIKIDNTATGGIKGTTEERTLDWTYRDHEDHMFGSLRGRSRWFKITDPAADPGSEDGVMDAYLMEGWEEEGEDCGPEGESKIQSISTNDAKGWTADMVWGFAIIDGKRYHTRRVVLKKGDKVVKVRLVYNWQGKK